VQKRSPAALLAAILSMFAPGVATGDVYITELLASNQSSIVDEDGDFSDWIELYNGNAATVDLNGWYLTDDASAPTKWRFPATAIPPGGYLVVFASDKNRAVTGAELHTNFKLGSGGEYLAIVRSDGVTIEHAYAPSFPAQTTDVSWGLTNDSPSSAASSTSHRAPPTTRHPPAVSSPTSSSTRRVASTRRPSA
jgi:hypothetical protein